MSVPVSIVDMIDEVCIQPSQTIIHRYGDMLLGVFFLKESTFSIQEGLRENPKIFHSGKARAFETIVPIRGKYPLPLSGFNYNPGCLPMCFVTDQPNTAFFIFGMSTTPTQHREIARSTKWLDVNGELIYHNQFKHDQGSTIQFTDSNE